MGLASEAEVQQTMVVDYFTDEWRAIVQHTLMPILAREGRWRGEVSAKQAHQARHDAAADDQRVAASRTFPATDPRAPFASIEDAWRRDRVASVFESAALRVGFEISQDAQSTVQLRTPLAHARGEARSDLQIVFALADRLGAVTGG